MIVVAVASADESARAVLGRSRARAVLDAERDAPKTLGVAEVGECDITRRGLEKHRRAGGDVATADGEYEVMPDLDEVW